MLTYDMSFWGGLNCFNKYDHSVGKVCDAFTSTAAQFSPRQFDYWEVRSTPCFLDFYFCLCFFHFLLFWCEHYNQGGWETTLKKMAYEADAQPHSGEHKDKLAQNQKESLQIYAHIQTKDTHTYTKAVVRWTHKQEHTHKECIPMFSLYIVYIQYTYIHTHTHRVTPLYIVHLLTRSPVFEWIVSFVGCVHKQRCNLWRQTESWRLHH